MLHRETELIIAGVYNHDKRLRVFNENSTLTENNKLLMGRGPNADRLLLAIRIFDELTKSMLTKDISKLHSDLVNDLDKFKLYKTFIKQDTSIAQICLLCDTYFKHKYEENILQACSVKAPTKIANELTHEFIIESFINVNYQSGIYQIIIDDNRVINDVFYLKTKDADGNNLYYLNIYGQSKIYIYHQYENVLVELIDDELDKLPVNIEKAFLASLNLMVENSYNKLIIDVKNISLDVIEEEIIKLHGALKEQNSKLSLNKKAFFKLLNTVLINTVVNNEIITRISVSAYVLPDKQVNKFSKLVFSFSAINGKIDEVVYKLINDKNDQIILSAEQVPKNQLISLYCDVLMVIKNFYNKITQC